MPPMCDRSLFTITRYSSTRWASMWTCEVSWWIGNSDLFVVESWGEFAWDSGGSLWKSEVKMCADECWVYN